MNLLSILVGFGIAWLVRRWYWALLVGIAIAVVFNGVFDWISYGDPLLPSHRNEMLQEALEFGGWGLVFCLARPLLSKLRRGNF